MASLLLDHNLPPQLARLLERAGHAAMTALEAHLEQATDRDILRDAGGAGLIIITADEDFIHLHRAASADHAGVLFLPEIGHADVRRVAQVIAAFLDSAPDLTNELYAWTLTSGWTRVP